MENAEHRDVDNVVNSRNIWNDEGNVQARGEIREVGDGSNNGVGGGSRQGNGEVEDGGNTTNREPTDKEGIRRQRSFSEDGMTNYLFCLRLCCVGSRVVESSKVFFSLLNLTVF